MLAASQKYDNLLTIAFHNKELKDALSLVWRVGSRREMLAVDGLV